MIHVIITPTSLICLNPITYPSLQHTRVVVGKSNTNNDLFLKKNISLDLTLYIRKSFSMANCFNFNLILVHFFNNYPFLLSPSSRSELLLCPRIGIQIVLLQTLFLRQSHSFLDNPFHPHIIISIQCSNTLS